MYGRRSRLLRPARGRLEWLVTRFVGAGRPEASAHVLSNQDAEILAGKATDGPMRLVSGLLDIMPM